MEKSKKEERRERKSIKYKNIEERKEDVKNLIKELSKFELNPTYQPIKELYGYFKRIYKRR